MKKVLILTDLKGWHYDQLITSFKKLNISVQSACLDQLSIRIENNLSKIYLDNKALEDITDVFVRHIPGGSLEQIIVNLNILKIFELNNINIMNSSENIETTVDKSLTSIKLSQANLFTPKTWVFRGIKESKKQAQTLLEKHNLIYKPLFGSQGDNVTKVSKLNDFDKINNDSGIYYLQEFIETDPSHDYRVLVIRKGNKYLAYTMARYGSSYVNNYSKGGKCLPVKLDNDLIETAVKAAKVINIPFCGVDIIKSNGKNYIIEINSIPAWKGMQSIIDDNISDKIVASFLSNNLNNFNISALK